MILWQKELRRSNVVNVAAIRCWKCLGWRDNATCNGGLAHRTKWTGKNPEKVRGLSRKYGEEHKEEQSRI